MQLPFYLIIIFSGGYNHNAAFIPGKTFFFFAHCRLMAIIWALE